MKERSASEIWTRGNSVLLLENGEEFFPRVFGALENARQLVLVETFILNEDKVGLALRASLCACARRGIQTVLTIDGFGSPALSPQFMEGLTAAGVRVRVFDPGPSVLGQQLNLLRRMHRKLVVVDNSVAFVGGINFSADHLLDFGPMAKQDYAVEMTGPVVDVIRRFLVQAADFQGGESAQHEKNTRTNAAGGATILFTPRDKATPDSIEYLYRKAIRAARFRIVIANAYFFPGYRLFQDLCAASRRGVMVRLVLQGMPDMKWVRLATTLLYGHLLRAGVDVQEYCARPFHGKIAFVDDTWSTVGSSNLDPVSLSLNMEANVFIRSEAFNSKVATRLAALPMQRIAPHSLPLWNRWPLLGSFIVFHVLRWVSRVGTWLPRKAQKFTELGRADVA